MPRSGIRAMMEMAGRMQEVIHLEVGEPNFPTPPHIVEAACAAAREGYTKYTPGAGFLSLREAIGEKLASFNGIRATPDEIVVTPGAVAAMYSALMATVDAGEEVLIPDPGWPNYEMMVRCLGAIPRRYPLASSGSFLPQLSELRMLVSSKTKALILNSPGNPTGSVFPAEVVQGLTSLAAEADLYLISDEIYESLIYEGKHVSPAALSRDGNVITVSGFSKTYAMTGWRVGYAVAARPVAELMAKLQEPIVSCASAVSQKAAEAALRGEQDTVEMMRRAYMSRRDAALTLLAERGIRAVSPHGSFYLMIKLGPDQTDSLSFALRLLERRHVAVAPGSTFGRQSEGWIRVSLATEMDPLLRGLDAIASEIFSQ